MTKKASAILIQIQFIASLKNRMTDGPARGKVQAKTGTLNGVSALAGWADPPSGGPVNFAVVSNGVSVPAAQGAEDKVATALATLPPVPPSSAYAPQPIKP